MARISAFNMAGEFDLTYLPMEQKFMNAEQTAAWYAEIGE